MGDNKKQGGRRKQGGGAKQRGDSGRPVGRQLDARLRRLCTNREVVRDLIIVALPHLKDEFDFSSLRKISAEFLGRYLKERRADCIWRVNLRDSDEYKIVLVEFQARSDWFMAARMLNYVMLLYDDLYRQEALDMPTGRLPDVIPVVLFCGPGQWGAKEDIEEMIGPEGKAPPPGERPPHWARQRYHLVDMRRHPVGDVPWENLFRPLFALARADIKKEDILPLLGCMAKRLRSIDTEGFVDEFYSFLREIVMTNYWDNSDQDGLERVEAMAAEAQFPVPRWYRECSAEYRAKGLAKGRKESLDTARKQILQEVSSRFDAETAGNLAERLESITDLGLLMKIPWQIRDGMAGPELLAWMDAQA